MLFSRNKSGLRKKRRWFLLLMALTAVTLQDNGDFYFKDVSGQVIDSFTLISQVDMPSIDSITPSEVPAGGTGVTLLVTGSGFINESVLQINGITRPTSYLSSTQLIAQLSAADIQQSGVFPVKIVNAVTGGGVSNEVNLTVTSEPNPVPVLSALAPASALAGGSDLSLTLTGTNFVFNSIARLNGIDRPTTLVNDTELTVLIPAADLAAAGTFEVTVFNPEPAGGLSNSIAFTVNNPMPVLSGLSPISKTAGDGPFTLSFSGSGFTHDSVVRWNGTDRSTIFVTDSELTAEITDADILTAGIFSVTVFTPTPGGGTTSPFSFTVNNPLAELSSISPSSVVAGAAGLDLTVIGNNFFEGVVVRWNGSDRPTLIINSGQLIAQISAADVQTTGIASVSVFVPPPGGGVTPALNFTINNPGFEGDVAPRPNGSNTGSLSIADWVQAGRFASGLDIANCNGEFQRADVAPKATLGGGTLTIADWVQAGRYASGLDPAVPAGGPNCAPLGSSALKPTGEETPVAEAGIRARRLVQIDRMAIKPGQKGEVAITLEAHGNENALGFSLNFIPAQLNFVSATNGADAQEATLIVNADQAVAGRLDVSLALPPGEHFKEGRREVVVLTFESLESNDLPLIGFTDQARKLEVVDFNAEGLAADFFPLLPIGNLAKETNPIDEGRFFVNQNYLDFLGRAPESQGLDYWTSQFSLCGTDQRCILNRRVAISAAFFIEQEFQQTGFAIQRLYKAAYGVQPSYAQFLIDRGEILRNPELTLGAAEFAKHFVERPEFQRVYPDWLPAEAFVNRLFDHAGAGQTASERREAVEALSSGIKTRPQILIELIENPGFKEREYNPAFVLMQYFGYLRRDPDQHGYEFWLNVLNNKEPPGNYRGMVCSFITSSEYQHRFGQVATRSNADCDQ